jgi:DNA-binding CsgD family transcriptional regulator
MLQDKKRKDIADELSVTGHTIKKHTAHIFAKLEVTNRKELHEKLGIK